MRKEQLTNWVFLSLIYRREKVAHTYIYFYAGRESTSALFGIELNVIQVQ
jgi:hypothetical protein